MNMFDRPLSVVPGTMPTIPKFPERPALKQPTAEELNITYHRNNREDIDTRGYKSYLFHFRQTGEVGDKEMYEWIISKPTMEEAIQFFEQTQFRGDYYENAVIEVEIIGCDFKTDREYPFVMEQ